MSDLFGDSAVSWPLVKLLDCCDISTGKYDANHSVNDGAFPFYTCAEKPILANTYSFDGDSIILAGNGANVGLVLFYSGKFEAYQRTYVLNGFKENVYSRYVFHHLLKYWKIRNERTQFGSATNYIRMQNFQDYEIPLPPLAEQKRIAAILDKADAIRRKRQQAIKLADEFLRSVFLDMFGDPVSNPKGWERCKFEELTTLVTYGLTVRPQYYTEGIPLISAREIRTGELDFDSCPKISKLDFDVLSEKGRPVKNDILFSKTGSIGHCAIVRTEMDFAVTQNAARIVPNRDICEPIFLLAFMRTKYFYDLANKEAKGNAVKDLQLGVLKNFPMYVPPISLQKKFVEQYSKAVLLFEKANDGSNLLNSTFNSLSQKAFSGQL